MPIIIHPKRSQREETTSSEPLLPELLHLRSDKEPQKNSAKSQLPGAYTFLKENLDVRRQKRNSFSWFK